MLKSLKISFRFITLYLFESNTPFIVYLHTDNFSKIMMKFWSFPANLEKHVNKMQLIDVVCFFSLGERVPGFTIWCGRGCWGHCGHFLQGTKRISQAQYNLVEEWPNVLSFRWTQVWVRHCTKFQLILLNFWLHGWLRIEDDFWLI